MTTSTNKGFSPEAEWVKQINKEKDEKALIPGSGTNESETTKSGTDVIAEENRGLKKKKSFRAFLRRIYSFLLTAFIF
jgi:hypothetical protein